MEGGDKTVKMVEGEAPANHKMKIAYRKWTTINNQMPTDQQINNKQLKMFTT